MDSKQILERSIDKLNKVSRDKYDLRTGHLDDAFIINILNKGRTIIGENNTGLTEEQGYDLLLYELVKLGIIYARELAEKYSLFP